MGDVQATATATRMMKTVSSGAGPAFTGLKGSISVIELYALMEGDVHSAGAAGVITWINYDCNGPVSLILSLVKE